MIRLRTFGGVDVRLADEDRPVQSVLAQPKRVGLLVYLAVLRGRETRRRDALLNAFWPESDMQRSRNSLNQALHYLRRSLGDEVLLSLGDEEVAVNRDEVWADAHEFEEALARGETERALELYAGEFLAGFFVEGAPEFERWADEERGRFRRLAVEAAQALAASVPADDSVTRERWLRRLLEIEPFNAQAMYRLIELLAEQGERARALELAEQYRTGLKREFEAEPSPELERLVEVLRSSPPASPVARQAVAIAQGRTSEAPPADPPPAPLPEAPPKTLEVHEGEDTRMPDHPADGGEQGHRTGLVIAAVLLLALGITLWPWGEDGAPAAPVGGERHVAVFPFSFRGSAELGYLGEGASSLLTTSLDEMQEVSSVDSNALLALVGSAGSGPVSPARGADMASDLGAGLFVLGDIVQISSQLRVQAALYRVNPEGPELLARGWVQGRTDDVFTLIDGLAPQLGAAAASADTVP